MTDSGLPPDDEMDAFVSRYLVSFAAWDLLVLLHAQPDLCDSPERLAYRLGRPERELRDAVSPMLDGGLLETRRGADGENYCVAADVRARRLLDRFVELSEQREWRLEMVRRVLNRLA